MDALLSRCHNRITTCLESGTVTQTHQKLFCIVFTVFLGSYVLVLFGNFSLLLYLKVASRKTCKSFLKKELLLLECSILQAHTVRYMDENENWENAK